MVTPTNNPVPSQAPQDLLFNAEKLDEFINSTAASIVDRRGHTKRTIAGTQLEMDAALRSVGRLPPVVYAAGLSMTSVRQTVAYSGVTYAPRADMLPFTTGGTFEVDKFEVVQGISGADLAAPAGLPAFGFLAAEVQSIMDNALPLQSYSALRSYTGRALGVRITQNRLAGFFLRDASISSADDGGTIIVDGLGRRWIRIFDGSVMAEWFGAVDNNDVDVGLPMAKAFAVATAIGRSVELGGSGKYRWRTSQIFLFKKKTRIFSNNAPTIVWDNPENTIGVWFRRDATVGDLFSGCGFEGINHEGVGSVVERTAMRFSDAYGHYVRRSFVNNHRNFIQLYNETGWTEGFELSGVMLRSSYRYLTFDRVADGAGSATDSFGHMNLRDVTVSMETANSVFMAVVGSAGKRMSVYNIRAEKLLAFFDGTGGGKALMLASGNAKISGELHGSQDFYGGIYNGSDLVPFFANNGGQIDLRGCYDAVEIVDAANMVGVKPRQLIKVEPSYATVGNRPAVRFKGAFLRMTANIAEGVEYIYDSGSLPPGSSWRITLSIGSDNYQSGSVWEVKTLSTNEIAHVGKIVGDSTAPAIIVRGVNGYTGGASSPNVGARFQIYRPAGTALNYSAEIEML